MSGKNFETLEVGGWYRQNDGSVSLCIPNTVEEWGATRYRYPFILVRMDGRVSTHCVDGKNFRDSGSHSLDAIERVANAQGDPWQPEQPPQTRPFKVGDVVRITDKKPEDYTGKGTDLGWCIPMRKHLGEVGEVRRVDRNCVEVWVDELNDWWTWLDRDLTLIKAVDEPEQVEQVEETQKAEEVIVIRNIELFCQLGDCEAALLSSGSIRLTEQRNGSDYVAYYDRELLNDIVAVLTRLRDELRG